VCFLFVFGSMGSIFANMCRLDVVRGFEWWQEMAWKWSCVPFKSFAGKAAAKSSD